MNYRTIGKTNEQISAIGLGCMAMASGFAYGPSDEQESVATLHRALDLGINFWDSADMYAEGNNERLVSKVLVSNRDKVFMATKFGFVRNPAGTGTTIDVRPERIKKACEDSLQRLGIDTIDLYYAHRIDPQVPVEDMVGAMSELVTEGKVRYLGLSEASAQSLRRAYSIHPIAALQSEYSLFTRDVEIDILPTCRELGITFVPYSPLGRGMLTNTRPTSFDELAETDYRRMLPRFQAEALDKNQRIVTELERIAGEKGCTTAQLALAWLLAQGDDIVPIPGTKRRKYLEENAASADIRLSADDLAAISQVISQPIAGARYSEGALKLVNH